MATAAGTSTAETIDGLATGTQSKDLKNKPKYTKFRQQKLPAWQPILTASTVIPAFVAIGVLFIPLGIVLLSASDGVIERVFNYTDCESSIKKGVFCADEVIQNPDKDCNCLLNVTIDENMTGDVYFYYGLSNFYQNHRRYVKSRNDQQLLGNVDDTSSCEPFAKNGSIPIVPCGAIANSMFNDTFTLNRLPDGPVPLTYQNVAWPVDADKKFANPKDMSKFENTAKPPAWTKSITELDPDNPDNNGLTNVDFMVWMRTAALPTFRKLWRKLNRTDELYQDGLPAGNYSLEISYRYPVKSFSGEKRFIISTTSWIGGKNNFLGVAYIVVGSFCLALAIVFGVIHWKFGHSLADMSAVQGRSA